MLTIALPTVLTLCAPQEPKAATQLITLQHICTHEVNQTGLPWGSLLQCHDNLNKDLLLRNDAIGAITPTMISDVLQDHTHKEIDAGRLLLQTVNSNLLMIGEPQLVTQVSNYVTEATNILARPMQVELCVWDATGTSACSSLLNKEAFADFTANRTPMMRAVSTANAGDPLVIQNMTWSNYVRSIGVEVAQKQAMSRPETDHFGEGCSAMVRAYSLVGSSDFAVHMQFAAGKQHAPTKPLHTGLPSAPDIELPHIASYFGTCSGRITNGGALATTLKGSAVSGGQITITLRIISTDSPTALSDKRAALLPIGALISEGLNHQVALPNVHSEDFTQRDPALMCKEAAFKQKNAFGVIPPDQLEDLATIVLAATNDGDNHQMMIEGGYIFIRASEQGCQRVKAMIQALQDDLIRNVEIHHSASLHAPTGEASGNTVHPVLHSLTLPTLLGREASAYRLLESNIAANIEIQIASEAGTLEPIMHLQQSGTWFRARTAPVGQGLHASLELLSVIAPTPATRSVMPGGGVLMPAQTSSARRNHDGILTDVATIDHGDGPPVTLSGQDYRSKLSTTFSH
jgi:hypothetical protein